MLASTYIDMEYNIFELPTRPKKNLLSSRNKVDLLLYNCKTTDNRQQNNRMGGKNLDG